MTRRKTRLSPHEQANGGHVNWVVRAIVGAVIGCIVGAFVQSLVPWFPWELNLDPHVVNYVVEPSYWEGDARCILRGQKVFIDIEAKDWNRDCLEYIWNIFPGQPPEGRTRDRRVTYTAPSQPCRVYIHITVYDGRGGMAELLDEIVVK